MSGKGIQKRKAMEAQMEEKRSKVKEEQVTKVEMVEQQEVDENLTKKEKLALQERSFKLKGMLQAIPYNQLSSKQKDMLAELSKDPRCIPSFCLLCKEKCVWMVGRTTVVFCLTSPNKNCHDSLNF